MKDTTKFGELIKDGKTLVLFFSDKDDNTQNNELIVEFAALNHEIKCIKINTDLNQELTKALELVNTPTWIVFNGDNIKRFKEGSIDKFTKAFK